MDGWMIEGDVEEHNQMPEFEIPPLGMYTWEIVGKDEDQPQAEKYDKTGTKKRTRFHFKLVDDEDWEGFVVKQYLNLSLNEKSHFRPFVEAAIGRTLGAKEKVGWNDDPDNEVVGIGNKKFQAVLTEDKKEDGRVFAKLTAPIKLEPRRKPKAKQSVAEEIKNDDAPF